MKFSEMPYNRIDMKSLSAKSDAIIDALNNAETFEQADKAFNDYNNLMVDVSTNINLVLIRNHIDTTDEFYDKEQEYNNTILPELEEMQQKFALSIYDNKFKPQFTEKYSEVYFKNIEVALKSFSPEISPELQADNKLCSEYSKLCASAQIDFDGKKLTVPQMSPYMQSIDNNVRKAAWNALGTWYNSVGEQLDEIYDKLVKERTAAAKKMGYDNFVELGYYRMGRNCYDKNDVEKFRNAVAKYITPIVCEMKQQQAKRMGVSYPMTVCDDSVQFRSGNPKPQVSSEELLELGKKFYHELSPETAEFIDAMYENEMLDVLSKSGKANGGFCDKLPNYKLPFIFANFNGTSHDVEVLTHEAGHAFAYYRAKDVVPYELSWGTMESCEIHSMSMEFFAWPWCDSFFKGDTRKYYYTHLGGALELLPYVVQVDHFQHEMYEHPELTPAQRHETWKRLEAHYRPWLTYDETPFYGEGRQWQRQQHIYLNPFYYIDYALAQTVALEFWTIMQKDPKNAWERYMKLISKAGTQTFRGLVETAGLDIPFDESALQKVAETAHSWLKTYDLSGIE